MRETIMFCDNSPQSWGELSQNIIHHYKSALTPHKAGC